MIGPIRSHIDVDRELNPDLNYDLRTSTHLPAAEWMAEQRRKLGTKLTQAKRTGEAVTAATEVLTLLTEGALQKLQQKFMVFPL